MDWIIVKLDWTPEKALSALASRLQEDVDLWKSHVSEALADRIETSLENNRFSVALQGTFRRPQKWAALSLARDLLSGSIIGIDLHRDLDQEAEVVLTVLNSKAEPRFRFAKEDSAPAASAVEAEKAWLELWQMSRLILEPLLF